MELPEKERDVECTRQGPAKEKRWEKEVESRVGSKRTPVRSAPARTAQPTTEDQGMAGRRYSNVDNEKKNGRSLDRAGTHPSHSHE